MMTLDKALRWKDRSKWTLWTSKAEIESVNAQAVRLEVKFQEVRNLILAERYAEGGAALEELLAECPTFLRTNIMGLGYVGIKKIKADSEQI